jgi:hypothetical protein
MHHNYLLLNKQLPILGLTSTILIQIGISLVSSKIYEKYLPEKACPPSGSLHKRDFRRDCEMLEVHRD